MPALLAFGAAIALALLNWHLMTMDIDISPTTPDAAAEAVPPILFDDPASVSAEAQRAAFPQTLARPLFRAERRPLEREAPRATAPLRTTGPRIAKLPDDLELVGIMQEGDQAVRAMIRSGDSPTGKWVEVGHLLNGWRLSRIETGSVLFEADGQQHRLTLFSPAKPDAQRATTKRPVPPDAGVRLR
jgi:hypothetical protein